MRKSSVVRAAVIAGGTLFAAHTDAAVILQSIEQHMFVSVTMTDGSDETVVERSADNATLAPTSTSLFAHIPMGFTFDYSYASLTMDLSLGGGSIIEADNHLFVEHFIPYADPAPGLTGTASIVTIVEFEFTGGVDFTMFATLGGGGPDNAGATTVDVDLLWMNESGEFVEPAYSEDGYAIGRYRAGFLTSLTLTHPDDGDWSAGSFRSRHVIQYVPSSPMCATACIAVFGAGLARKR